MRIPIAEELRAGKARFESIPLDVRKSLTVLLQQMMKRTTHREKNPYVSRLRYHF